MRRQKRKNWCDFMYVSVRSVVLVMVDEMKRCGNWDSSKDVSRKA